LGLAADEEADFYEVEDQYAEKYLATAAGI
jgi:hypothetical protein